MKRNDDSLFYTMIANSLSPLFLFLFNYIFIPTFVDYISYYEEYETKSARHRHNLSKQFFFIIINTLFIPITLSSSIKGFLLYLSERDFGNI